MTYSVEREVYFPQSPEAVWRALTDSAALAEWLMPNDFEPRVGHRFSFRVEPNPGAGFDGMVLQCEVLECAPPSRLAYSWVGGGIDTRVSYRLEREAGGTRMFFEQSGFESTDTPYYKGARAAWPRMLGALEGVVAALAAEAGER